MKTESLNLARQLSFLCFFCPRQMFIPLSTMQRRYVEAGQVYDYLDVFVFGFRVARFHQDPDRAVNDSPAT